MTINKDKVTTVAGIVGALAGTAAPMASGSTQNILVGISSFAFAIVGYFTGKSPQGKKLTPSTVK